MGQELTIGRGYSNLLRLEGEEISRVHAIIYRRNNGYIIRDLDSKNGVYVNGSKAAFAELESGDRVQVGKYQLIFDPPSDFNVQHLAESGMSETASGSGSDVRTEDSHFAHSRKFSAAPPPVQAAIVEADPEPEICREEVLIYTRPELDNQLSGSPGTLMSKVADYQEDFFNRLIHETTNNHSIIFSGAVLRALVKAVRAHRGVVILRNPETNDLSPAAVHPEDVDVAVNSVVLKSAFSEGKAMLCPSAVDCGLFRDSSTVMRDRIGTLISVPLGTPDVLGLLYIDRQGDDVDGFTIAQLIAAGRTARLLESHLTELSALEKKNSNDG